MKNRERLELLGYFVIVKSAISMALFGATMNDFMAGLMAGSIIGLVCQLQALRQMGGEG